MKRLSPGILLKEKLTGFVSNVLSRPELDFDFLLNVENLQLIKENIKRRKGVGDIVVVHKLWKEIKDFPKRREMDEQEYRLLWERFFEEAKLIPNVCHPDIDRDYSTSPRIVRFFGEKRQADGLHTAEVIAKAWKSLYNPHSACGERSYAFIGPLADLERALLSYVWTVLENNGFKLVVVPDVIHQSIFEGCGLQQRLNKSILYHLQGCRSLCLSGTSEVGLCGLMRERVFRYDELPIKLTALSRCYRPEIATGVAESKLYRVHEFNKIEMFVVCEESDSDSQLNELVRLQSNIFATLGLHCRLLDMPPQELGPPAARKFDIEAWMPGRKMYGEVSSASNCTDFQTRRLGIKYYDRKGMQKFAHTCNATAVATTRTLIALIETFQNEQKGLLELPVEIRTRMPKIRSWTIKKRSVGDINTII